MDAQERKALYTLRLAHPALAAVHKARGRREIAERDLRQAVVTAFTERDERWTVDDIAEAAGLSRQRIYQLVKESEDANTR